ncbi:MAG: hypothetical protein RIT81_44835 [Deltaproteobacteria bacterium]
MAAVSTMLTGCLLFNEPDASNLGTPVPVEACTDGVDNDGDDLADCADPGCFQHPACDEGAFLAGGHIACRDGIDNDDDGSADCEDEACFAEFHCVSGRALVRDEPCAQPIDAQPPIEDDFDLGAIDLDRWIVFSTSEVTSVAACTGDRFNDRPVICDGRLFVNGRDNNHEAGLASTSSIVVGLTIPFELSFDLEIEGTCDGPSGSGSPRCVVGVRLETGGEYEDDGAPRNRVFAIEMSGTDDVGEIQVICSYHNRAVAPVDGVRIAIRSGDSTTFRATKLPTSDTLRVFVEESEICAVQLRPTEPLSRLVLVASGNPRSRPGRLLIDNVSFFADRQNILPECLGLRVPSLPSAECDPESYRNTATTDPKVVVGTSGHLMAFAGGRYLRTGYLFLGSSTDGRTDWTETTPRLFDEPPVSDSRWFLGTMVFDRPRMRFLVWAGEHALSPNGEPALGRGLWTAAAPDGPWSRLGRVTSEQVSLPRFIEQNWLPATITVTDGGYRGWFAHVDDDGREAIFTAVSSDGLQWTIEAEPVLRPGDSSAWDADGVLSPAVFDTGDYLVMAYASPAFDTGQHVGLAFSTDGLSWVRHVDNPVMIGDVEGFDDRAVHPGTIRVEDSRFRIWYTADSGVPFACADERLNVGTPRRIGLAELEFAR